MDNITTLEQVSNRVNEMSRNCFDKTLITQFEAKIVNF
jgi:hypothetical protein